MGYPNVYSQSWVGFFVPAKTDAAIVAKLNAAIDATMNDAAVKAKLASLGFDPLTGSPDKAEAYARAEVEHWGQMVKTLNLSIK